MKDKYVYDLAISFAEEDRTIASGIATALALHEIDYYYYPEQRARMVGSNILDSLDDIYEEESRFALLIVSSYYLEKRFTIHEYKAIQRRLKRQKDYIIPVKVGDVDLTDLNYKLQDIVYFQWESEFRPLVEGIILEKLGKSIEKDRRSAQEYQNAKNIINIDRADGNTFNLS
ncbi:MAG: toll/interleukin-1 receptor domain-containing protein [Bacteroidota bacterium]